MPVTTYKFGRQLDVPKPMGSVVDSLIVQPGFRVGPILSAEESDAFSQADLVAMLAAWITALTAPKVGLYTNALVPTPATLVGDLAQPIGSWYALKVAVFGEPFVNADGSVEIRMISAQFNYSGVDAAETIRGYFIQDTV